MTMRLFFYLPVGLLICSVLLFAESGKPANIIPLPQHIKQHQGEFILRDDSEIHFTPAAREVAAYMHTLLSRVSGYHIKLIESAGESRPGRIVLTAEDPDVSLGEEGYRLKVSPDGIVLSAGNAHGLFYAVQTLRQLLPPEIDNPHPLPGRSWAIPAVSITDRPRFRWRGMHLDVARHLFSVDFIKKYLDLMALHKMNTFHWHLTDDQGWRIEIGQYPRLTEIGSMRSATPIPSRRKQPDGLPYGGFYTKGQIREIVAYAQSRFITVVPEIEMPGHSMAALTAYPQLGCTGGPYEVRTWWGVDKDIFCAGNDSVFTFLENVLLEVMDLFPGQYIHIGGDEAPKDRWQACDKCQLRIREEGLANEHELQSWFVQRMERFLSSHGKRLIGWDEILEGGLAPGATVMSWRGISGGIAAAEQEHDVIMSPNSHCYFDHYQSRKRSAEPPAIGGHIPLEKVYAFEPVPVGLSKNKRHHILGAQGNVWTEYLTSSRLVEYMAYPRAIALAEVLWSAKASRNYRNFRQRLKPRLRRLDLLDVYYRDPFGKTQRTFPE